VDENNWSETRSIRALFGDLCSGDRFAHDEEMRFLQTELQRDMGRVVAPDNSMRISECVSSQLVPEYSQWKDSDLEDLNEQKWAEQLRLQPSMETYSTKTRSVSPMKRTLKRGASGGGTKDSGLAIQEKRSRLEQEITTRRIQGTQQGTECGGREVKAEPLSGEEEEPGVVSKEAQMGRDEWDDDLTCDEGEEVEEQGEVSGDTIDEAHLLVGLRGDPEMSQVPRKQADTSLFPLANRLSRNNDGRSSTERENQNQKPHMLRIQKRGAEISNEGTEDNHLTEEQRCLVTTQPSARSTSTYHWEVPPDAAEEKVSSTSNTVVPKGIFGIHITSHLPLPLPSDIDENFDLQQLREATMSALQISGRSWWNVDLQSTRRKWKYEKEVEL